MSNIQYYLVHGGDPKRKERMETEFKKWSFFNEIKWVLSPNKDELSDEFIKKIVIQEPSISNGQSTGILNRKGAIACSYKHYLCLKDIVENKYDYGVIIEDNIYFTEDFPGNIPTYIEQLNNNYKEWDILFNHYDESHNWGVYDYQEIKPNLFVYPKSNEINHRCHGASKSANCYLLTYACAKQLYENYLPFANAPCAHMNGLFRKLSIKSFWLEPSNAHFEKNHVSTTRN